MFRYPARLVLGGFSALCAQQLAWEHYVTHATRGFVLEWFWPFVFAAAAVATGGYLARPDSRQLWRWSGGLLIAAYGSRALAVAFRAAATDWTAAAAIGTGIWFVLAALVYYGWLRFARPGQGSG